MTPRTNPEHPLLLVDDEKPWLRGLARSLERNAGINNTLLCDDSREVMDILAKQDISLVLLDLTMPHIPGDKLLTRIAQNYPQTPVIVISGMNQIETAVRCMKLGAFDYFVKTSEEDRLVAGVLKALRLRELESENIKLRENLLQADLKHPEAFAPLLTRSPKMMALFHYIEAVAGSNQPILISGESGTGKELFARAAHKLGRPQGPWVALNAAGLDDNVFSDTLFGHCRGAFTGADQARQGMVEQAEDGTLFLDEIGDLSAASQIKLLRLLQEGEYLPLGADKPKKSNARVVVATNQDLLKLQQSGEFRRDLYYRLQIHQVQLPPLRERKEDLSLLLDHFLAQAAGHLGKKTPTPPDELAVLLATYQFPGNIRELEGMATDAVSRHQGGKLSMDAFKRAMGRHQGQEAPAYLAATDADQALAVFPGRLPTLEETAFLVVDEAMRRAQGNQSIASGLLGISRPALNKRLKKRSMTPP